MKSKDNTAVFSVVSGEKVKTLQANFKKAFGPTLRVYKGQHFADENAELGELVKDGMKDGYVKINGDSIVEEFEKRFKEITGITVQVATPDNSGLAKNNISLLEAGMFISTKQSESK